MNLDITPLEKPINSLIEAYARDKLDLLDGAMTGDRLGVIMAKEKAVQQTRTMIS